MKRLDGKHWDTGEIRREREFGWFKQNEGILIEEARRKREAAEKKGRTVAAENRRLLHWHKCPECGNDMSGKTIEGVDVKECGSCSGIFFNRGELEQLLLKHDEHKRGFFRRLLGFGNH